jgi:hypothetical protein
MLMIFLPVSVFFDIGQSLSSFTLVGLLITFIVELRALRYMLRALIWADGKCKTRICIVLVDIGCANRDYTRTHAYTTSVQAGDEYLLGDKQYIVSYLTQFFVAVGGATFSAR